MTIEKCLDICTTNGYTYAAITGYSFELELKDFTFKEHLVAILIFMVTNDLVF